MFDCRQIKRRLGRYHDGELPPAERVLVERHLQNCRLCSQELEEIREVSGAFQRVLVIPPVPRALTQRILAQARARRRHFPSSGSGPVLERLVVFNAVRGRGYLGGGLLCRSRPWHRFAAILAIGGR